MLLIVYKIPIKIIEYCITVGSETEFHTSIIQSNVYFIAAILLSIFKYI